MDNLSFWNDIYNHFSLIAFSIGSFSVHWYGIAYVLSLIAALYLAKHFANKYTRFSLIKDHIDMYFIYIEIGIIVGARYGYLLIYSHDPMYYLTHPWQAFNPFQDGKFIGFAGMSYHGALIGALLGSMLFAYVKKVKVFTLLDLVALSMPLAYVLGRIGNFLNKELYGRPIESSNLEFIGIYVNGALRYPSQLFEAFLEGIVVFIVIFISNKLFKKDGVLISVYMIAYGFARFIAEFSREADVQMGYYFFNLTMGQILSFGMILVGIILLLFINDSKDIKASKKKLN